MYLYLIRHAVAESKEVDPEKSLSEEGVNAIRRVSKFFSSLNPDIYVIWHSGKRRAKQTAEILAEALNIEKRVLEHQSLAPNDDIKLIREKLANTEEHNIAIVGHLPYLSRLASYLLTGDQNKEVIRFRNAGIVCLLREESVWQLNWMITPEIIS